MTKKIMIIDDSALMRRVISDIIREDDRLSVGKTANNGQDALKILLRGEQFDVILADISMPKMDGIQLIREINRHGIRIPVIIVSSIADRNASETMEALELGAFDFVKKPTGSTIGQGYADFRRKVLLRVYMACGMSAPVPARAGKQEVTGRTNEIRRSGNKVSAKTKRLVFIASSTGGPKALQLVIPYFPEDFPYPIVVVQHMPAGFTESLANRLNDMSPLTVKEAQDGDVLKKGFVYIAQGGKQCELVERPTGEFCLSEKDKPARGGLKPCADIFLESLVSSSMDHFVCGVLTGMGSDACEGIRKVKSQKDIKVVAQNKETCVVYGMPRAVAEAGVVDEVVPLKQVADTMIKQLGV